LDIIEPRNILTITDDSPAAFISDTFRVLFQMRKAKIDITFDLELFSRFTAILTYLSGASKRIGFSRYYFEGLYRGNLLTHNIQYNPMIHTSKTLLSLLEVVKLDTKTTPELQKRIDDSEIIIPKYISPRESIEQMWVRLGKLGVARGARLFLTNPGDGIIPMREWPLENYINLAKMLLKDEANYIIIIGTGGVSKKAAQLALAVNNPRCLDLTNQTLLSEVMALYNTAEALISNDCGLAHIASLTPIKKFVIFGPESPQVYRPLGENSRIIYANWPCSPCLSTFNHRNSSCANNFCLKAIKPEEVYALIEAYLGS
jgi:ADP-heptose:LPS heptosyltransferase